MMRPFSRTSDNPVNTPIYYTLLTHPIDTPYWHILLTFSFDTSSGTFRTKNGKDEDDYAGIDDDEELTREKVKRASSQILSQIDRKKRKPKKKGGKDDFGPED